MYVIDFEKREYVVYKKAGDAIADDPVTLSTHGR